MIGRRFSTMILAALLVAIVSPCRAEQMKTYDASLGTLPDAQGWELHVWRDPSPDYYLVEDALHQGLSALDGYQWWESSDVPLDFDMGAIMEAELKIISSSSATSDPDNSPRAGYSLWITDDFNRGFSVNIASGAIFLRASGVWTGWKPFTSTDDFHHYRLVVDEGFGRLYIDHGPSPFLSLAVRPPAGSSVSQGAFGDATILCRSESLLKSFSYQSIPEPSTFVLLGMGALGVLACARQRRRR